MSYGTLHRATAVQFLNAIPLFDIRQLRHDSNSKAAYQAIHGLVLVFFWSDAGSMLVVGIARGKCSAQRWPTDNGAERSQADSTVGKKTKHIREKLS